MLLLIILSGVGVVFGAIAIICKAFNDDNVGDAFLSIALLFAIVVVFASIGIPISRGGDHVTIARYEEAKRYQYIDMSEIDIEDQIDIYSAITYVNEKILLSQKKRSTAWFRWYWIPELAELKLLEYPVEETND